ncbi:MAG: hypothetical protein QG652_1789, partial [Pseudomonadota bacterium]|nr:hypothetical protein [Pseudomonadota bacterium]
MSLLMPTAMRFYKTCAITGTLIIVVTVAYAWMRIQQFEQNVFVTFERLVTENLEAESLKDELQHIEKVLEMAANKSVTSVEMDTVEYTSYEIERLRNDRENLLRYMRDKNQAVAQSSFAKNHIM